MSTPCTNRVMKELSKLNQDPPPGVAVWPNEDDGSISTLGASISGPKDTPYEGGTFQMEIVIPSNYPFTAPKVKFKTPIYHPNIDSGGRICLDLLKQPPAGNWNPCLGIATLLESIQLLMATPNTKDPLMADINKEFIEDHALFESKARKLTEKHAIGKDNAPPRKKQKIDPLKDESSEESEESSSEDDSDDETSILSSGPLTGKKRKSM